MKIISIFVSTVNFKYKEMSNRRYSKKELLELAREEDLSVLSSLSGKIRREENEELVFYNKNFHVEPSNICIHRCKFCSYRRDDASEPGSWSMSLEQIENYCVEKYKPGMTEVHIVGSVHPSKEIDYYVNVVKAIRRVVGDSVTIKGYSAVEINDMAKRAGISYTEVFKRLQDAGLSAIPGGGAEIFSQRVRDIICPDKASAQEWLDIHRTAHGLGIRSNATMLFGHIETWEERVDHLLRLRELQDETGGFDSFIPLKYRIENNLLAKTVGHETGITDVLRIFAISRIALDNIKHLKSYWPMLGKELFQMALLFGADDMDGTINDSTKIYSMAGAEESKPVITVDELKLVAEAAGFRAVERDSFYNVIGR